MSYNLKCCSFYPNNFDASALTPISTLTPTATMQPMHSLAQLARAKALRLTYSWDLTDLVHHKISLLQLMALR